MMGQKLKIALLAAGAAVTLGACATAEVAAVEAVANTRYANLTGAQVIGGRGDPDASAEGFLTISDQLNQICYDIKNIRNLDGTPTKAVIGRAPRGRTGPTVMELKWANEGGFKNCTARSEWMEDSLDNRSGAYYIAIYTTAYPNGAIRGNFYDK
ncbi:hypothetical protein DMP17_09210 [Pseudonocardia sp. TMWB2A]